MTAAPPRTSRQFAAVRALRARLAEQAFPPHHTTGEPLRLPCGYTPDLPDLGSERLGVTVDLEESRIDWQRVSPAGRDEEFLVDVWIASALIGQSDEQVWDRLEVLSDVVQLCTYDPVDQKVRPLGYAGEVQVCRVAAHRAAVWGSGDGFVGQALVSFQFQSRI